MKAYLIVVPLLLALSGCSHTDIMKPVEVDIPTPVPCHNTLPDEPAWAMTTTPADSDIADQGKAALIELHQHQAYEERLKAQILACS